MPFSTFLDGQEPTQLRGLAWLSLSGTAVYLRGTFLSDGGGGGTATWTARGTVPCRIDPLAGGREDLVAGRISDRSTHVVTVPPGTDIEAADRVSVATRGTFEVVAVRERTREWLRKVEVVAT